MGMICIPENENKQAILEALIQKVMEEYREHSVFFGKRLGVYFRTYGAGLQSNIISSLAVYSEFIMYL